MEKKYTPREIKEFNKMIVEYKDIPSFIDRHPKINYISFDYSVVNELNLFNLQPDFDFDLVDELIKRTMKYLPAIKKIFAKPVIHLKESNEILPVESVRLINNATINHIATHSELWDDIVDGSIKPIKLLTNSFQDNYSLYENIIFCNTMDSLMGYVKSSLKFLKNLLYTNQSIELNLLERLNHMNYFLALGKLHTGYLRNYNSLYSVSNNTVQQLEYINGSISSRLKSPVYKFNKNRNTKLKLYKTNIFSKHKEYHQIYLLMQFLSMHDVNDAKDISEDDLFAIENNYFNFCQILTIFSIGHFNFNISNEEVMSFNNLNLHFNFKKWKLIVKKIDYEAKPMIQIEIEKEKKYTITLIPEINAACSINIEKAKEDTLSDECIICNPYDMNSKQESIYLSISYVESFRKIQQLILRGMIKADSKRDDCPFCVNGLVEVPTKNGDKRYQCEACRTEITDTVCPITDMTYTYTTIIDQRKKDLSKEKFVKDDHWLYRLHADAQMHFRNITKLSENMECICPCCGEIHHYNDKK